MSFLEISLTNIILWFFVGLSITYTAHRRDNANFVLTSMFSILGAETGGYLASFILGKAMHGVSIEGLLYAGIGALVVATFYRFSFNPKSNYTR